MADDIIQPNDAVERKETIELFTDSLVAVLEMDQPEDAELTENYNITLMRMMLEDDSFRVELAKALQNNQEKLTFKKFELDGKPKRPTVANWLVDFIKQFGAEMFDNLNLSRYLINSKNAKLLDENEKELVKKLLLLYRNLKFFPESMKDRIVGEWEIFPIEQEESLGKIRTEKIGIPKSEEERELEELKKLAEQFPEGSLERRAVEEEISKISNS